MVYDTVSTAASGRVPAGAVQDRRDGARVHEAVLLGEPVIVPHRHLHPAVPDRYQLGAHRGHHRLAAEAGPHPRLHRRQRLRPARPRSLARRHPPMITAALATTLRWPGHAEPAGWSAVFFHLSARNLQVHYPAVRGFPG
jgi:hypothetical protein